MLTEFAMTLMVFSFYATGTISQAKILSIRSASFFCHVSLWLTVSEWAKLQTIFTCALKKKPILGVLSQSHVAAQAAQGVVCSPASLDSWCDSASAGEDGLRTQVTQPTAEAEW